MKRALFAGALLFCVAAAAPESHVSIDVRNAQLSDVVALLAKQAGANVIADPSVGRDRVTLRLANVGFRQALDMLAASRGLLVVQRGHVLVVGTRESLLHSSDVGPPEFVRLVHASAAEVARILTSILPTGCVAAADPASNGVVLYADPISMARAKALLARLDVEPSSTAASNETASYRLRYTRASDVAKELKTLFPAEVLISDDEQNAIVVTGDVAAQRAAAGAIERIDVPGPQVLFEVRVADVTPENDSRNVGFEFGGLDLQGQPLSGATTYAFTGAAAAINVRLNALVTRGKAQILATPRLVTLNGKEADLLIGETYPVVYNTSVLAGSNVQFVDIGVKLRLTPIIGPDGSVTAELHPEYSELAGFTASGYPIIANRKIDSTLRVHSGQTIVLGGLLRETSNETIQELPWLSQIPILGKVFSNKQTAHERDEIVFLITPRIIDADTPPSR
jgi:type II secretory pathway component GspD/PulD (secretin)